MKLALICFSVLTSLSLSFGVQEKSPSVCRGKPLPIMILPGPKMTAFAVPLRFGGERPPPLPWVNGYPSKTSFRLVIRNRDEFSDFWKGLGANVPPGQWMPPLPEIDFAKEMIIVAAMGERPSSGYTIMIDGVCEVDGHVEVFVSSQEGGASCGGVLPMVTAPADAVRIPKTDLPIVFREIQIPCDYWQKLLQGRKQELKTWND
ncbi:MAG TPA: protease complex subunit PrcB family protein [Pyrinomonadaceae bacterium]|nr:protease complex subunit PrcB family protein [Pyrinomonadaceae bacterium]